MAHGKLTDLMTATSRSLVTGRRSASAGLVRDIVRELHGEVSGDATAKMFAGDLSKVFEDLRNRFKRRRRRDPEARRLRPAAFAQRACRPAGGPRRVESLHQAAPSIPTRMRHPLTGEPVGAAGLDKALDYVFDSITTTGWAHHAPQMRGVGAGSLATQRQEHRFLAFKSADDWMAYNGQFGDGDPVQAIFRHINGMAKDIGAMEVLGPNPAAMVQWMCRVSARRSPRATSAAPRWRSSPRRGAVARGTEPGAFAEWRIQSLYAELRGGANAASGVATAAATIKNLMNSALLGAAGVTAAATDPFIAQAARRLRACP